MQPPCNRRVTAEQDLRRRRPPQIHAKGSKSTPVTVNATRRVDLSALTKEPFFQRAPPPPPPPPGTEVHDVPV